MKRLLFTLAIAASFIGFSSFTNQDDSVSPAALKSFNSSFKSATEVNWTVNENFYKANFSMNGQNVTAYYNTTGQMIALTRNISSLQLPIALQANLKNNYDGYWISDLVEMANDEGTSYFITLENADTKLILKSTSNSEWNNYKKQKKS
jgi:hypothetical protein